MHTFILTFVTVSLVFVSRYKERSIERNNASKQISLELVECVKTASFVNVTNINLAFTPICL